MGFNANLRNIKAQEQRAEDAREKRCYWSYSLKYVRGFDFWDLKKSVFHVQKQLFKHFTTQVDKYKISGQPGYMLIF